MTTTCALGFAAACGGAQFREEDGTVGGTSGSPIDRAGTSGVGHAGNPRAGAPSASGGSRSNPGAGGDPGTNGGTSVLGEGAQSTRGGEPAHGGTATAHAGSFANGGTTPAHGGTTPATDGGAGASDGGTADGGSSMGGSFDGGAAGSPDLGGTGGTPQGGTAGSSQGGIGGSGGTNGGTGGASCTALDWFPDDDGDDYGRSSGKISACTKPSSGEWVQVGGDCNDDNDEVLPDANLAEFSAKPYTASNGEDSFDYDCSGGETSDPGQFGPAVACNSLLGLDCKGKGFLPTGRTGPGVNPLCGSQQVQTCSQGTLACTSSITTVPEKHRCR